MTYIQAFALLLSAHFIADIFAYSPKISNLKRGKKIYVKLLSYGLHCLIHAVLTWLVLYSLDIKWRNIAALYIFVLHSIIDLGRVKVESLLFIKKDFVIFTRKDILNLIVNNNRKIIGKFIDKYQFQWFLLNIIDQSLHIASIIFLVYIMILNKRISF